MSSKLSESHDMSIRGGKWRGGNDEVLSSLKLPKVRLAGASTENDVHMKSEN